MPYASNRQSRFIHAKASEGVGWAKKFVADSHGTHVPKGGPMNRRQQNTTERVRKSRQPYREPKPSLGPQGPKLLGEFSKGAQARHHPRNGGAPQHHHPGPYEQQENQHPGLAIPGNFIKTTPLIADSGFKTGVAQHGGEGSLEKNIQGQAEEFAKERRRRARERKYKEHNGGFNFGGGATKA